MYDFISDIPLDYDVSVYDIKMLHSLLYEYSNFPDLAGKYRTANNRINKSDVETVDYTCIDIEMLRLSKEVDDLLANKERYTKTKYIDEVLRIHHELTIIHPFDDGNGRSLRGFMNMLFRVNQLPIVYVSDEDKIRYLDSLQKSDRGLGVTEMSLYIFESMFNTSCELTNYHN